MSNKPVPTTTEEISDKIKPRSKQERAFWLFLAIVVGVGLLIVFAGILASVVLQGHPLN